MTTSCLLRILSALVLSAAGLSAAGEPLFRHAGDGAAEDRTDSAAVVRTAAVEFAPEDVFPAGRARGRLELNLFPDLTLEATLERAEVTERGVSNWYGKVRSDGGRDDSSLVVFTRSGDMVLGTVLHAGRRYVITRVTERVAGVAEVDPRLLPAIDERMHGPRDGEFVPYEGDPEPPWSKKEIPPDDGSKIDVLVLWSDTNYQQTAGNVLTWFTGIFGFNPGLSWVMNNLGQISAFVETVVIPHAIAVGNNVLVNSGVNTQLNLVHAESVNFSTSGDLYVDVDLLANPSDGVVDHAHQLREKYAADIVLMITDKTDPNWCGMAADVPTSVAWSWENRAFAVIAPSCLVNSFTLIHEAGHLLAGRHDWYVDSTNLAPFSYNHGYTHQPSGVGLLTVMAYRDECEDKGGFLCQRLPYFSNGAAPLGKPIGSNQAADNATALNNTAYTVANYRASWCRTHLCP